MLQFKFRLYPNKAQCAQLQEHLWISKNLWNNALEYCKKTYESVKKFPTKNEFAKFCKGSGLYSQVSQQVVFRLHASLKRFLKLKREGKAVGFPRFKSIDRLKSLNYPQSGFKIIGKKLRVTPFGEINIKCHRAIEGRIKTLTLKRESSGKWFAVFCVEMPQVIPRLNDGEAVGIDLGLKSFATLSDGTRIRNPRFYRETEEQLAKVQRRLSRKKKGSKNRFKAKLKFARLHEKIANSRNDFLHKESRKLVEKYVLIALEDLKVQRIIEQNFGKSINDASWNEFAKMLCYKAEEAGCRIVFVNPRNTTRTCGECGQLKEMPLSERIFVCPGCGHVEDRDLNAARNILAIATAGMAGSNARGDETIVSSMNREAPCES